MNGKIQSVTELMPEKHFTSRSSGSKNDPGSSSSSSSIDNGSSQESQSSTPSNNEQIPSGSKRSSSESGEDSRVRKNMSFHNTHLQKCLSFQLPKMNQRPGTQIRYTLLPTQAYPEGSTPAEVTRHSMDSTYQLEAFFSRFQR